MLLRGAPAPARGGRPRSNAEASPQQGLFRPGTITAVLSGLQATLLWLQSSCDTRYRVTSREEACRSQDRICPWDLPPPRGAQAPPLQLCDQACDLTRCLNPRTGDTSHAQSL